MITGYDLKQMARSDMKSTTPSVFGASILFLIISIVFSLLLSNLSGYNALAENINELILEENLTTPASMEAFFTEHSDKIEGLFPKVAVIAYILATAVSLMNSVVSAGFAGYCLKVSRKETVKASDIFYSFEYFGKTLLIVILQGIFIILWSLLFVIPGIIAAYRYSQSFLIMYDNPDYSAYRCIRESSNLMRGHKGQLFIIQLSFIGWHFLNSLLAVFTIIPLLSVYIQPYLGITQAHFYNALIAARHFKAESGYGANL